MADAPNRPLHTSIPLSASVALPCLEHATNRCGGSRALLFGIEKGAANKLESLSAREWGRRQAQASPAWTDEQWRCACALLGIDLTARPADDQPQTPSEDQDDTGHGLAVAA